MPSKAPANIVAFLVQGGSAADDTVHTVTLTEGGSVILAGSTTGVWGEAHVGSEDFAASKLDAAGNLIWTWQVKNMFHSPIVNPCLTPAHKPKLKCVSRFDTQR